MDLRTASDQKNRWNRQGGQCWDVGFGSFASLFPRLRDTYEAILLNSRIPEPANIEFYGKYLSGEDFCYFLRFDDIMAGPREDAGERSL